MRQLVTQLMKQVYMMSVKLASKLGRKTNDSQRVVYLLGFPENNDQLIERLNDSSVIDQLVILYEKKLSDEAIRYQQLGIKCIAINSWEFFTKGLNLLKQAKVVLLDNYFAFLGAISFGEATKIYQIWHAAGAIKCFGWEDPKTKHRSLADQNRFQAVYDTIDYYVVGSQEMARVFETSYYQPSSKILVTGVPRTDYFLRAEAKKQAQQKFKQLFPEAENKQVVLYAPTYREAPMTAADWQSQLPKLTSDYFVLGKFHPHTLNQLSPEALTQLHTDLRGLSLKELLFSVDVLITDYSSIPFEYELANPQGITIYYTFDLEDYRQTVGLQSDFYERYDLVPILTKEALNQAFQQLDRYQNGHLICWNQANDGLATSRLVAHIEQELKK
ncbi:CDP-glycerol glycerophosphotransferase family protein [Vagococcus zengguangii]|uniref:CDP-glycerol glycerophosphotransferase family protein n=1 Tax=Vagococcus zengguangii TaxID=2571750 RepID=UPI00110A0176|nr:CDP-glycerol glycerophosphotransferase family protein [Vagococcus zengguangii]TLG80913.1 CDP-glycerol glycerophosphotransferase family protein [Vagococcus zengguangii]